MLEDAAGIRRVVIACGYVDLRKGIDGLSMIIGDRYHQNPFEKGTLFLFQELERLTYIHLDVSIRFLLSHNLFHSTYYMRHLDLH